MSLSKTAKFIRSYQIADIIPCLGKHKVPFQHDGIEYYVYFGRATQRLFKDSQVCTECGRTGTHFRLYHDPAQKIPKFINSMCLFSEDGVMMTADHIIPRSAGGLTHKINLQVMCLKCNQKKADKMPDQAVVDRIKPEMEKIRTQWETKYPRPLKELENIEGVAEIVAEAVQ